MGRELRTALIVTLLCRCNQSPSGFPQSHGAASSRTAAAERAPPPCCWPAPSLMILLLFPLMLWLVGPAVLLAPADGRAFCPCLFAVRLAITAAMVPCLNGDHCRSRCGRNGFFCAGLHRGPPRVFRWIHASFVPRICIPTTGNRRHAREFWLVPFAAACGLSGCSVARSPFHPLRAARDKVLSANFTAPSA